MTGIERFHSGYVHPRRVRVLRDQLAEIIPAGARVLDVGAGDGLLASLIAQRRPDLELDGIDTLVRKQTYIRITPFDGKKVPYENAGVDIVMLVDVLHHADDPMGLLREARRVTRRAVIIKDHLLEVFCAGPTLRFMDRIGNERHDVSLPYNYWTRAQWNESFRMLGMTIGVWKPGLGLYPLPAKWIFERSLHFLARLDVDGRTHQLH